MKLLAKILGTILYTVLCYFAILLFFRLFEYLTRFLLKAIWYSKDNLHPVIFWVLFFFIGISIIASVWEFLLSLVVLYFIATSKLSPYTELKTKISIVISGLLAFQFIINYWSVNSFSPISSGIIGVYISGLAISLSFTIIRAANVAKLN
jgi:hypothetical protein